jgi:nicotinamidase/pyrazinamidase
VLWPDHCVQGTADADLHKDLKLPTAQLIIRKGFHKDMDSYSAFEEADHKTATGLAGYLKRAASRRCSSPAWPPTSASPGRRWMRARLGFDVYVIEDATRAIDLNGSLAAAWKQMAAKGVKRIQSGRHPG